MLKPYHLKEIPFSDKTERDFCVRELIKIERRTVGALVNLIYLNCLGLIPTMLYFFGPHDATDYVVLGLHLVFVVLIAGYGRIQPRLPKFWRRDKWVYGLSAVSVLSFAVSSAYEGYIGHPNTFYIWELTVNGTAIMLLLAYRNYAHAVATFYLVLLAALAYCWIPSAFFHFVLATSTFLLASNLQILWRRDFKESLRRQYRSLATYVPRQLIDRGLAIGMPLAEVFRPTERFCVCLCSDWRNYQALSAQVGAAQLADHLSRYYTRCNQLLREISPEGNYLSDWIADELFVVFFDENTASGAVISQCLKFAQALLREKEEFHSRFGVPEGIDIGISVGEALVGVIGPEGGLKATALGEVPGRARRLQSVAKAFRKTLGNQDRIVLDPGAARLLGVQLGHALVKVHVEEEDRPKDLPTSYVYTVDSKAAA